MAGDGGRAARQLRLIAETVRIAGMLGVEVWLRGGWAMDFFLGEVTRDHDDIDWHAWGGDAAVLKAELLGQGYEALPGPPPDQQLDFIKDGLESSFGLLDRDHTGRIVISGGTWAGEPWPEAALDPHRGRIGSLECAIVGPRNQIVNKQMMPVWVPGRPLRAKDSEDIARLRTALGEYEA